jgi:hypothetical protein
MKPINKLRDQLSNWRNILWLNFYFLIKKFKHACDEAMCSVIRIREVSNTCYMLSLLNFFSFSPHPLFLLLFTPLFIFSYSHLCLSSSHYTTGFFSSSLYTLTHTVSSSSHLLIIFILTLCLCWIVLTIFF